MYGYELVRALAQRTDGVLAMGQSTLYPLLYGLEAKGLLRGTWRIADSGRRRKYYGVTPKGAGYLKSRRVQWQRLVAAMGQLGLLGPAR
jgi:PadR family transcriptional regulator PadR